MRFKNIEIPRFCCFLTNIFPFNNNRIHLFAPVPAKRWNFTSVSVHSACVFLSGATASSRSGAEKVQLDQRSIIYAHPSANSICRCDFSVRIRHAHRTEPPHSNPAPKRNTTPRGVQLRKHSKAREKRYSSGYAVSFIFACYQILWTFPKSLHPCGRYPPLVCG